MKRRITSLVSCLIGVTAFVQSQNVMTHENYANEIFKGVVVEMQDYREINSGSKFVITYEGDWPEGMVGAFEHAIKIWEEVLPPTLPINLTVSVSPLRGSRKILSKVEYQTVNFRDPNDSILTYPTSAVKSVLLQEYNNGVPIRFYSEVDTMSIFNREDIKITYNDAILKELSFSLDPSLVQNKYDFITVVLRDIAVGLGFNTNFVALPSIEEMPIPTSKLTPFESLVMNELNTDDPKIAYTNGTKGILSIPLIYGSELYYTYKLYAPNPWINGLSLQTFVPEEGKAVTQLLTHDFGKGYIMRDLSGTDWRTLFCSALDWRPLIPVGSSSSSISQTGTTSDILPYKGDTQISFNSKSDTSNFIDNVDRYFCNDETTFETTIGNTTSTMSYLQYCDLFNCFSADSPQGNGLSVSALLNDGTWDCLYMVGGFFEPLVLNMESFPLHYDETKYARGTTGGLRYRITNASTYASSLGKARRYKVKYFTRDFTPQAATIKYSHIYSESENLQTFNNDDDYFIDVVIGISHIEGASRVIVEQWDEGEPVPFQYEVENFRDGYFIANLDRELSTQLTVVSYNQNGFRLSNTITIPAIGYDTQNLTFTKYGDDISITGLNDRLLSSDKLSCTVANVINPGIAVKNAVVKDGKVSVGDLSSGIYVLALYNGSDKIGDYKFVK